MAPKSSKGKGVASSIQDVLRQARVNKGQGFSFGVLLTQILRVQQVEEEEVDYRLRYDPKGLDGICTNELEGLNVPLLAISERNACIDNVLSHLVGPGFEEPFDDDDSTDDEQARVD
ncbi:hypothetical protein HAX54_039957 [Datura stramonium]|uniref:Uncharacterized protein n=1 Tax=Datura stramonium TaxID=4076 RepID=A0ABS8VND2_DATST|nr:hypothetical protein [Datura stramonium]